MQRQQLNTIWHCWRRADVIEYARYVQVYAGPMDPRRGPDAGGRIGKLNSVLRYLPKLPDLRRIDFISDAVLGRDAELKDAVMTASLKDWSGLSLSYTALSASVAWGILLSSWASLIFSNAPAGGDSLLRIIVMGQFRHSMSHPSYRIWSDVLETQDFCNLRSPCTCCRPELPCIRWSVESLENAGAVGEWVNVEINWNFPCGEQPVLTRDSRITNNVCNSVTQKSRPHKLGYDRERARSGGKPRMSKPRPSALDAEICLLIVPSQESGLQRCQYPSPSWAFSERAAPSWAARLMKDLTEHWSSLKSTNKVGKLEVLVKLLGTLISRRRQGSCLPSVKIPRLFCFDHFLQTSQLQA